MIRSSCASFRAALFLATASSVFASGATADSAALAATSRTSVRALETPSVPRQETVDAQLDLGAAARRAMRGTEGTARESARAAAVRAYRAVREHHPERSAACAEAAFRAGELLRAADDAAAAAVEFEIARARGDGTAFRARAGLELGHLQRRAAKLPDALAAYEGVASDPSAAQTHRDDAWLLVGRVCADLGRADDAVRAWERVATGAQDPLDRVRAFDSLALARLVVGDADGAASVLARCRDALSEVAQEETSTGERVRSALQRMRANDELERVRTRRGAPPTAE